MSSPVARCFRTTSSTAERTRDSNPSRSITARSSFRRRSAARSSGRGRLPMWVVRICLVMSAMLSYRGELTMAGEYAYVMKDLKKVVPPKREIRRGSWLSVFHGAKIGVLGANGAGKSSLLRIMAGVDDDFLGEAWAADGLRVGHLPQEPRLDPAKDVRGNVNDGVSETRALLERFETVSTRLGEPLADDEMEKLLEEQSRLQDSIDAANAWDLDRTVELAMDAL